MVPDRRERHLNFCDFSKSDLGFVDSRYDPARIFERREEKSIEEFRLGDFFSQLPVKEQTLVRLRYGIGYSHPYSISQCAGLMHVSSADIRRMESHAMITMQDRAKQMPNYDVK